MLQISVPITGLSFTSTHFAVILNYLRMFCQSTVTLRGINKVSSFLSLDIALLLYKTFAQLLLHDAYYFSNSFAFYMVDCKDIICV